MKARVLLLALFIIIPLLFTSCGRDEPFVAPPAPTPAVNVKLNEVFSRGDSLNPDWIEIYNPGTTAINIGGYKIYDNGGQSGSKPKMVIPAGTSIPALGFYSIVVDISAAEGFGLSSSGEKVWLENASGTIIDSVDFPAIGSKDTTYGRFPDGSSNWIKCTPPTRDSVNKSGSGTVTLPVMMNEIYSRGVPTDPDWIEIFNPNTTTIDLSGYFIYDGGGQSGTKPKMMLPPGSVIPANGYLVVVTDSAGAAAGFGLSSAGETVWLENAAGSVIDNVAFPAMDDTQSYSRIPNGSTTWQLSNTITRGAPNMP